MHMLLELLYLELQVAIVMIHLLVEECLVIDEVVRVVWIRELSIASVRLYVVEFVGRLILLQIENSCHITESLVIGVPIHVLVVYFVAFFVVVFISRCLQIVEHFEESLYGEHTITACLMHGAFSGHAHIISDF